MRGFLSQIPFIKPAIMDSRQAEICNAIRLGFGRVHALSQRFSNANRAAYCHSLAGEFEYRHEVR